MKQLLYCLLMLAAPASAHAMDGNGGAGNERPSKCVLPRTYYCQFDANRERAGANPDVVALRQAVCMENAAEAERLLPIGLLARTDNPDARFALAELLLLKGGTAEARMAFDALRRRYPDQGWGDWGLGMIALADGRELDALAHMRAGAALGGSCVEAETAVLLYLQSIWQQGRQAVAEAGFLELFTSLTAVRNCISQQRPPG